MRLVVLLIQAWLRQKVEGNCRFGVTRERRRAPVHGQLSITAFEPSRWRSQLDKISEERSEWENLSAAQGGGFKPWKWVRSLRERVWSENRREREP